MQNCEVDNGEIDTELVRFASKLKEFKFKIVDGMALLR